MGIGLGIVLLLVGLLFALGAVGPEGSIPGLNVDWGTMGWIFVIVGVLAIVLSLVMARQRTASTHHTVVEERRDLR